MHVVRCVESDGGDGMLRPFLVIMVRLMCFDVLVAVVEINNFLLYPELLAWLEGRWLDRLPLMLDKLEVEAGLKKSWTLMLLL